MPRLTESEWNELASDLARRVEVVAPGWTNENESDPGVTIVALIQFLSESLLGQPERTRSAVTRLRHVVEALDAVGARPCQDLAELTRVNYFHGRVLSVDDFELEQRYVRNKQRRHNLLLHGIGVVRGLDVTVETGAGGQPAVGVSPGVAIAPDGEELMVCERMTRPLAADQSPAFVALRLVDRLVDIVPAPHGEAAARIDEVVELEVLPSVAGGPLAIARLELVEGAWRVDSTFRPSRAAR